MIFILFQDFISGLGFLIWLRGRRQAAHAAPVLPLGAAESAFLSRSIS
jgi:hypothetical protein